MAPRLPQADVNLGGRAGASGMGGEGEEEAPLQWADFHLLAKAFRWASCQVHKRCPQPPRESCALPLRPSHAHLPACPLPRSVSTPLRPPPPPPRPRRRVVVDGVINNSSGWRQKVLSLAERQAASSRAATANAASLWRHRAARLGRRSQSSGTRAATATAEGGTGSKPGSAAAAPSARQLGREESDMLAGAVSAEATPRAGLGGTDIVVDESPRERGAQAGVLKASSTAAPPAQQAQHAAVQQAQAAAAPQRQMSPIVQQLMSRLRSNAAAAADAGATGSEQQALAALRTVSGSFPNSRPGTAGQTGAAPSPLSRAASTAVAGSAVASGGASSAHGAKLSQRWLSRCGPSMQSMSRPAGQGRPPCTPSMSAFAGGSASEQAVADSTEIAAEAGQAPIAEADDEADAVLGGPDAEPTSTADTSGGPADGSPGNAMFD